jgi:hypothetical protein
MNVKLARASRYHALSIQRQLLRREGNFGMILARAGTIETGLQHDITRNQLNRC